MQRKRRSSKVRQRQIIEAARKVIIKYGSENVTIGRIAKETGITQGAIYRHFKSKKEVLSGMADLVVSDLLHEISRVEISGIASLDTIEKTLKHHILDIQQGRGTTFQVIAEIISLGDKNLNNKIYQNIQVYLNKLESLLAAGIKSTEIKGDLDTEAAAMLLFGMIQGIVNIWTLGRYSFDIQKMFSRLWKIYRASIQD